MIRRRSSVKYKFQDDNSTRYNIIIYYKNNLFEHPKCGSICSATSGYRAAYIQPANTGGLEVVDGLMQYQIAQVRDQHS